MITNVKGKVKWFNSSKGFGFLQTESVNGDIFAHYLHIVGEGFKHFPENSEVIFDLKETQKDPETLNIRKV